MKKELKDRLSKYEIHLKTAYKADFIRSLTSTELEGLIEIGKELGIIYKPNSCPKCRLSFVKRLADLYYNDQVETKKRSKTPSNIRRNK